MEIESEEMRKLIISIEWWKRHRKGEITTLLAELGKLLIQELNLPTIPDPKPEKITLFEFVQQHYNERIYWEQCQAFYDGKPIESCMEYPLKPGEYFILKHPTTR